MSEGEGRSRYALTTPPPAKRKAGHPMVYDRAELVPLICEDLAQGIPLEEICRRPGMPTPRQVHDWKRADPEIAAHFAHAREVGMDAIAERLRLTARGRGPEDGGDSTGDVTRDKLIVETDLKLLAKWSPRYADRLAHTNRDGTGDAVLRIETAMLADELASLINVTPTASQTSDEPAPLAPPKR